MADALFNGGKLRALTVVDNYRRDHFAIELDASLKADDVARVLVCMRGGPRTIKVDHGGKFISKTMDKRA